LHSERAGYRGQIIDYEESNAKQEELLINKYSEKRRKMNELHKLRTNFEKIRKIALMGE
jgi:hypothetical protein